MLLIVGTVQDGNPGNLHFAKMEEWLHIKSRTLTSQYYSAIRGSGECIMELWFTQTPAMWRTSDNAFYKNPSVHIPYWL